MKWLLPAAALLAGAAALAQAPEPAEAPPASAESEYDVIVWTDVLFGPDGALQRIEVPEAENYSDAFVARLRQHLARARITPVLDAQGQAASFQTGVGLTLRIRAGAGAGSVRLLRMTVAPRPVQMYAASRPNDVAAGSLSEIEVLCQISTEGRCDDPKLRGGNVVTPAFRRWAVASMRGWRFEPQRVNGQPVPGEYRARLTLSISARRLPSEFRRQGH